MKINDKIYVQSGVNKNFPEVIKIYDPDNDLIIPEWLSDNLRCTGVTDDGRICVKVIRNSKSREYFLSDGVGKLYVPFGSNIIQDIRTGKLLVLTKTQISLLYEEKKKISIFSHIFQFMTKLFGKRRFRTL